MNRIARALASACSFSLILSAPGVVSYQAAAQTMAARAAVRVIPSPYAAIAGLPSLQAGLSPALSPSAALSVVSPVAALQPLVLSAAMPAAVIAAKTAAPVSALAALQTGSSGLGDRRSADLGSGASSPSGAVAALNGMYEGEVSRPEAPVVSERPDVVNEAHLEPSGARELTALRGPDDVPPANSLKRTFAVGFLAAVTPIVITFISTSVAQFLGYQLHPNYQGGGGGDIVPSIVQSLSVLVGASVMAPLSEEAIFRGGLQGGLAWLSAKLRLGSFVLPALISSLIFVALHETADPLMFATRMAQSMILGYVYHKEGVLAAMAAHGLYNAMLRLPLVFVAAGMPVLSLAPLVPLAFYFAWRSAKLIRAQRPAVASGALAPKPLSRLVSLLFGALLLLGYFTLRPSDVWLIGSFLLVSYGFRRDGPKVPTLTGPD
jgi:membrane protease YdiL (CAAX protease family)